MRPASLALAALYCLAAATDCAAQDESAPAVRDDTAIRFVQYNVRNYRLADNEDGSTKAKPAREIKALIGILAEIKPDILGICEMGTREDLQDLQKRLKEAGVDLPHSEWIDAADSTRHLALLSRFPIAERHPHPDLYYLLDDARRPMQRGLLDVTVQVNESYRLRLLGAHLKSQRDVFEAGQDAMRRNEAHLLRKQVDAILKESPEANLLVFGDFNEARDQPGVREIHGPAGGPASLRSLDLEDAIGQRWTFHYPPADSYTRIDYALASPGLMPEVQSRQSFIYSGATWKEASDHRPIVVALEPVDKKRR